MDPRGVRKEGWSVTLERVLLALVRPRQTYLPSESTGKDQQRREFLEGSATPVGVVLGWSWDES